MIAIYYSESLYHHGVKGQEWGVRNYQYADGSLTPAGRAHYGVGGKRESSVKYKVHSLKNRAEHILTGNQTVNGTLKANTDFARIQSKSDFENFAFYATYKKHDQEEYAGLFGKNLKSRANYAAKQAEKDGTENAQQLREAADGMKIYQLHIANTKNFRVPSDDNAGDITGNLIKDKEFKSNLQESINNCKQNMKRPSQQLLFKEADGILRKSESKELSQNEKNTLYKALNLSLTYHNKSDLVVQDKFYGELKKKGYDALLDYNDKSYSSYHAKRPMIVFNTDRCKLKSVTELDDATVDKLYKKYNTERVAKETIEQTLGSLSRIGKYSVTMATKYSDYKLGEYGES